MCNNERKNVPYPIGHTICKMVRKTLISIVFLAALFPQMLLSGDGDGGYAGAFLRIGAGARALGMGTAFTAIADDHSAFIYNPAGVALIKGREVGLSYALMSFDRRLGFVGFVTELKPNGGLGLGWINAGDSNIDGRDINGEPTGDLSYSDNVFFFSFAQQIGSYGAVGIGMRYLYQKLVDQTAKGFGIDAGARLHILPDLWIGGVIQNINAKYTWNTSYWERETTTKDDVPLQFRCGSAYRLLDRKLLLAIDVGKNTEQDVAFYSGGEYQVNDLFSLRAGLKSGELTAGGSFLQFVQWGTMRIDYTFMAHMRGLGSTHLFSLGYRF
jgi:hypothetical protein